MGFTDCQKVFESCDVIGDGVGAAIWERRHQNVKILARENDQVQRLVTALRDKTTTGAEQPSMTRPFDTAFAMQLK